MSNAVIAPPLIASYLVDNDLPILDCAAVANGTVTIFDGTTIVGTAGANADDAWDYTTGTLANGTYSITATNSVSGDGSASASILNVTVNSPAAPIIDSGVVNSATAMDLVGTAEANSTVIVVDGRMQLGTAAVNSSGAGSFTADVLSSGTYGFTATDVAAAENIGSATSASTKTVNTIVHLLRHDD